jgi:hypothetical protein
VVVNPPNAAALGKYGDIPVSMHTGIPNVNVPLHTINGTGGLSAPISLSYHASGIKVVETASWAGLGWTLNAGGAITRTVRGGLDEGRITSSGRGRSLFSASLATVETNLNPTTGNNQYIVDMSEGKWDVEPDAYNFNFNGYSLGCSIF